MADCDAASVARVTRHTSHVTRHTSHITRHTSHVTRHLLYTLALKSHPLQSPSSNFPPKFAHTQAIAHAQAAPATKTKNPRAQVTTNANAFGGSVALPRSANGHTIYAVERCQMQTQCGGIINAASKLHITSHITQHIFTSRVTCRRLHWRGLRRDPRSRLRHKRKQKRRAKGACESVLERC